MAGYMRGFAVVCLLWCCTWAFMYQLAESLPDAPVQVVATR